MAEFTYPSHIYDRPRQLLAALGSFWSEIYGGRDQILSYVTAKAQVEQQTMLDVLELIATMSRYTVPIFHRDNWYLLTLKESQKNDATTSLVKYDAVNDYDEGEKYDVPQARPNFAFPVPADLVRAPHVMNRFTEPSLVWTSGVDYVLEPGAIVFNTDPFVDPRVVVIERYDDVGAVVDREVQLWVFRGEFDWRHAYNQFGYAVGVYMRSSKGYRDLLNAVFDAITRGTTRRQFELALAVITGVPLVLEPTETVVDVSLDRTHRLVITDLNVYKFDPSVTVLVEIGDVVHAGDALTDALRITEFNRGETPDDLLALSMGRGFLSACFYGDLVFENKEVPLEVITDDPSGLTKVKFGLGGFPLDVERFFDEMHARGVAASQAEVDPCNPGSTVTVPGSDCDGELPTTTIRRGTLAHLLDVRTNPIGEPGAASLPRTINPLKFLIANVLRNNAFLVRVKSAGLGSEALGLRHARILQKIIPPHTAMILMVEVTLPTESVTVEQLTESLTTFAAANPLSDTVDTTRDLGLSARAVGGHCR